MGMYGNLDDANLYLSIGKTNPWPNDSTVPIGIDSVQSETDFWRRVFAHKRIDRGDVSLVVRRYDWLAGEVYSPYRDNFDLYDDFNPSRFYVLVDQERVYKCIDNNYGAASTVPPTHTDAEIRRLEDGYRWKFLYQIPESKRKFLTKSQGETIGYMPVEFIENLNQNDERFLQWNIQQSAVDGEIAFIYLNPESKPFAYGVNCVYPSVSNNFVGGFTAGATSVNITSPFLILSNDYYNNMVLSVDSGNGSGQRRRILDYRGLTTFSTVDIDQPLSADLVGGSSKFSIVPNIKVVGDGKQYNNEYNPYARSAEVQVRFGGTSEAAEAGISGCGQFETFRSVDSFELVDSGEKYTFATLEVLAGLTFPGRKTTALDINAMGTPIMSPRGGHGSNPVKELGASSIMIVKEFDRDEVGKIATDNEFRQIGIIMNPLLAEKQVRLRFLQNGLTSSFTVGGTAGQTGGVGFDAALGTVMSWYRGSDGYTGTSELVLTRVRNGNFECGGTVGSQFTVGSVDVRTVAGTESRRLVKAELVPVNDTFTGLADDFKRNLVVQGIGDTTKSLLPSRALGDVYSWEPDAGTDRLGYLYIENPVGHFKANEVINQINPKTNLFTAGVSGIAKIAGLYDTIIGTEVYDQTTGLVMNYYGSGLGFDEDTFASDDYVKFSLGLTEANGYVMSWSVAGATGATGYLRLSGAFGSFVSGMAVTGDYANTEAQIGSVVRTGELAYGSGDILYIQNIKPIARSIEQREEIKIVIDF